MPKLNGAWNFRDVADATGLRPGRFFRSSELSTLREDGRDELRRLGITDVADLRSPREVERRGRGQVPDDVQIHLLPFADLAEDHEDQAPQEHPFPHPGWCENSCATGYFAVVQRPTGDHSLLRGKGPHGLHGGYRARGAG